MKLRRSTRIANVIEPLELRIAPALLDVIGGALTFKATQGIANTLTVNIVGADYVFSSIGETVTLGAGAIAAGFTGGGTGLITAANAAINDLIIDLGDGNDNLFLQALSDPLTALDQSGSDTYTVMGALSGSGALTLAAENVLVNAAIGGVDTATLAADNLAVNATITAATSVTLLPLTAGRVMNVGAEVAGQTSLTDAEIDRLNAPVVRLGSEIGSHDLVVTGAISPGGTGSLVLISGTTVSNSPAGSISVGSLAVVAGFGASLTHAANDVTHFAARTQNTSANVTFVDADDLIIGTVDGVVGVTTGTGGYLRLETGSATQNADAPIVGGGLLLLSKGPYLLNSAPNNVSKIAGNTTGAITFSNIDDLAVGLVGGTAGVATVNNRIQISVVDGDLALLNEDGNGTPEIDAGTGDVLLFASSDVGTAIALNPGAGIYATGGVSLTANRLIINAPIDAESGKVTLAPWNNDVEILLGAPDTSTMLGISDSEIDQIEAGVIQIGTLGTRGITTMGPIDPSGTNTLYLVSAGPIADGFDGKDIVVANLSLYSEEGIGVVDPVVNPLDLSVSKLEAVAVAGGIFVSNSGGVLQVANVNPSINGIVAHEGDISIAADSSIVLSGTSEDRIVAHAGSVSVIASGLNSNIEVRNGGVNSIAAVGGNMTLSAGRDLLFGSPATGASGGIGGTGLVTLNAGRDIVIDEGSYFEITGSGSLVATSGHNFSLVASDGTEGARIFASTSITITTGVGGFFTVNSESDTTSVLEVGDGGSITVTSDDMIIESHIGKTTAALIHLQTLNQFRNIALGEEVVGRLGLTDSELDLISGNILRIGSGTNTANIIISGQVTQLDSHYKALSLLTGGSIGDEADAFLQVSDLAVSALRVNLPSGDYLVGRLAASALDSGTSIFRFINQAPLTIALNVDGVSGLNVPNGNVTLSAAGLLSIEGPFIAGPGPLELTGVGIRQTQPITQNPGGGTVTLQGGAGIVLLANANNDFKGPIVVSDTAATVTIADKNELVLGGMAISQNVVITAAGTVTQNGPITGTGSVRFSGTGNAILSADNTHSGGTLITRGVLFVNGTHAGPVTASSQGILSGTGTILGSVVVNFGGTLVPGPTSGTGILTATNVALGSERTFGVELAGTNAGSGYDRLVANGAVNLGGATLAVSLSFATTDGDQFIIIANDGVDPVVGTFEGLPEGAGIYSDGHAFTISYQGGDGNDVVLTAVTPQVTLSAGNKIATYIDPEGDLVTIKTSAGEFNQSDFTLLPKGIGFQLLSLNLHDDGGEFKAAKIAITAKRTADGGNGLVNVGYINSSGVDLGAVSVAGDLGRITVGDGDSKFPALKSLSVLSIGALGTSTQAPMGSLSSSFEGTLGKLTVRGDTRGASIIVNGTGHGKLGSVVVGGSVLDSAIRATAGIGVAKILGALDDSAITVSNGALGGVTVVGSVTDDSIIESTLGAIKSVSIGANLEGGSRISAGTTLGAVVVKNEITGTVTNPVFITAVGFAATPKKGADLAIKSVSVRGHVEALRIVAGVDSTGVLANADASIGAITVGGDWIASTVLAGVNGGADTFEGTIDDAKFTGGVRDSDKLVSSIASITIKGQAIGTVASGDSFGIVAELIGKARIGGASLPFVKGAHTPTDAFASAPTGPGATGLVSDFYIREATL